MGREILPLEVILNVAEYCPQTVLFCLARLGRDCYQAVLPLLYRSVCLRSYERVDQFCNSILWAVDGIQERVVTIKLHLLKAYYDNLSPYFNQALKAMLCSLRNLKYLLLEIPCINLFMGILKPETPYTFSLTRLTIPVWLAEDSVEFLSQQPGIEELDIGSTRYCERRGAGLERDLPINTLPRLRHLGVERWTNLRLIENRPVYSVDIAVPIHLIELPTKMPLLNLSSVDLTRLQVCLISWRYGVQYDIVLCEFLNQVAFCQGSLLDLTIGLQEIDHSINQADVIESFIDTKSLQNQLSLFTRLERFRLKGRRQDRDLFQSLDHNTTSNVAAAKAWRIACPSLKCLYMFDTVVFNLQVLDVV